MIRSVHGKLAAIMLALFSILGFILIIITLFSNRMYFQEASQRLNRSIAKELVSHRVIIKDGGVNEPVMVEIYNDLHQVDPGVQVYVLDRFGHILASSVRSDELLLEHVALEPIFMFNSRKGKLPIYGDDPMDLNHRTIFSACPIPTKGDVEGYLYITLGEGEDVSIGKMLAASHIARLSIYYALLGLLLVSITGLILFNYLTRRLRKLTSSIETFMPPDDGEISLPEDAGKKIPRDEIEKLQMVFDAMAKRIKKQVWDLEDGDRLRRELVTNISHDLRTPLTSLQGYLETLLLKKNLSDEERERFLETALKQSDRLRRMVADLFELSQLDAHGVRTHPEPFSVCELAQDIIQKFQLSADKKGVRLISDFSSHLPLVVADIGLMERTLENLVKNALQYSSDGGIVTISIHQEDEEMVVQVQDTGPGILKEDLPHIFNRYFRAGDSAEDAPEGTGLGLAIARRIVNLHEGELEVLSTVGIGTVFSFRLPVLSQERMACGTDS